MSVAVISKTGVRLMPTSEYRARKLLDSGKAIIYGYRPFTIQLTERETGDVQPWSSVWTPDISILEYL